MVKIWIDAGHGSQDSGATGNGLAEKNIVLSIALKTKEILVSQYGVPAENIGMTRTNDSFLSLSERANRANNFGADAFVSIHCNSGGGWGFESFRYLKANDGKTIAFQNALHDKLMNFYGSSVRDRGKKTADYAVLRETNMIACLTENLFMDNPEITKFNDGNFLYGVAQAHADGLAAYFGLSKKPNGGSQNVDSEKQPSDWAKDAWNWGLEKGIVDGGGHPHGTVTEEILIHILQRACNNGVFK